MSCSAAKQEASPACGLPGRLLVIDPLRHSGWDSLLSDLPEASFFHGVAWAQVLCETYGHQPSYFCTFGKDRLERLLPIMEVSSPFTGRRGVSLPFTDFCHPISG